MTQLAAAGASTCSGRLLFCGEVRLILEASPVQLIVNSTSGLRTIRRLPPLHATVTARLPSNASGPTSLEPEPLEEDRRVPWGGIGNAVGNAGADGEADGVGEAFGSPTRSV
jgi:hypothetical protein